MVGSTPKTEESLYIENKSLLVGDFMPRSSFESDLKPIGECILTDSKQYLVPDHQRDYSWENEVNEFWQDLIDYMNDNTFFFGSMVFQRIEDDDEKLYVLDGQQRLATIILLFSVIRDIAKNIDEKLSNSIHNNYITRELEDERREKLILNLKNQEFFLNCIQKERGHGRKEFTEYENNLKRNKSNKLIKRAYEFFKSKIETELSKYQKSEDKITYLKKLVGLRKRFFVIKTVVGSEEDAYLLFETINERGLDLSVADLFKNYLIRESPKDKRNKVIENWNAISKVLDEKIRSFLKHYWHSKVGVVTERKLFKELKEYVKKNKVDIPNLIEELIQEAEIYSKIISPNKSDWEDLEVFRLVEDLKALGTSQLMPILVVANKKLDKKEFKELLNALVNFTARYTIICGKPENILENRYSKIARAIRNGKPKENQIKTAKEALQELKDIYPTDDDFERIFYNFSTEKNQIAKYLLKKLDYYLTKGEKVDYPILTLEHIFPQKPDGEWKKQLKEELEKMNIKATDNEIQNYGEFLTNKFGNLTLLDFEMNRKIKNKFFTKKKEEYKKSKLPINENLKKLKKWDYEAMNKRQIEFGKLAKQIWKINF